MNTNQWKHSFILLITATIWGFAFVAQSVAMNYIETFTFNCIRFFMGSIFLLPYIIVMEKRNKRKGIKPISVKNSSARAQLWKAGIVCGSILCVASTLQQFGIKYTAVGKAGFITAIYILIVPILGIFLRKRTEKKIILCVILALIGLYLLCVKGNGFALQTMDWVLLLSALGFSFHILAIDVLGPQIDSIKLSCVQFFVAGIISLVVMFLFEKPNINLILEAWKPLIYAGVFSCGVAYTLQIIGQKGLNPTVASLIMSLESVISVLAGWLILHQELSHRELIGCGLVFLAIIWAQVPFSITKKFLRRDYEQETKTGF